MKYLFVRENVTDAETLNIDIVNAIIIKHIYNRTRSHKHGGKRS